jgi:hypothetical protein
LDPTSGRGRSSRQVVSEPVTKPLARGQAGALGHRPDQGKMNER